jgi:hypothetical protein
LTKKTKAREVCASLHDWYTVTSFRLPIWLSV